MSSEALTPISETYFRSERIRINLPFPSWVDVENIGIDLPKTVRLMNIGGINHLKLAGETNEERTTTMPMGVGLNPDGSRLAGMGIAQEKVKSFSLETEVGKRRHTFRNSEWAAATIHLNLEEVQRKIDEKKGDLRKAETWTPHINEVLRSGIRKAGTEHLLTRFTSFQKFFIFLSSNNTFLSASQLSIIDILVRNQPKIPDAETLIFDLSFNFIIWTMLESALRGRDIGKGTGYRISLFPGYEIDRAAILQVMSRTNKLVAPISPKKQDI